MAVALLFMILTVAGLAAGRNLLLVNNLGYTVWVGIQGFGFDGNPDNGGFELSPEMPRNLLVPDAWGGKIWGRTGCTFDTSGNIHCATGDCGGNLGCNGAGAQPPATIVQIKLQGISGLDYYNVSLVDGFNIPMRVVPHMSGTGAYWCTINECTVDLNLECPDDLKVLDGDNVVACKSSCLEYGTDEYCCRGAYSDLESCKSSPSAVYFKSNCPAAYSYAYDDLTSTFTCYEVDYTIVFG